MKTRTLDIALLLILLIVAAAVLAMYAILTVLPAPAPAPVAAPATVTPSPTATRPIARSPVPTLEPSATPVEALTPTPTTAPATLAPTPTPSTPPPTAPPGSTATPLPLVDRSGFLPHDTLFIRRHNDFAPPSGGGITSAVEDGITVEDMQITFDPFIPLTGVRVPGPATDQDGATEGIIAVRYGLVKIPLSQKRDARATHYLEIALKTAAEDSVRPEDLPDPTAATYVFVIDTSGSMAGAKISSVREAMRALFAELQPQDALGIVAFDSQARVILPATRKQDISSNTFDRAVNQLIARGWTDLNQGLLAGLEEIGRVADETTISYVYLFSDGNPTQGVTEWIDIRKNTVEAARGLPVRISTLAFGDDANTRELDALAGVTGGSYLAVADPEALSLELQKELARRSHLAVKNIRMNIEIDPEVPILHLFGHDQVEEPIARAALDPQSLDDQPDLGLRPGFEVEETGLQIYVPDLALGETYWIVLELALQEEQASVGDMMVRYVDIASGSHHETYQQLSLGPELRKLPPDLVLRHALSLWSSDVAFYAIDDLAQDDLATAEARLTAHVTNMEAAYEDLRTVWLLEDLRALRKLVSLSRSLSGAEDEAATEIRDLLTYALSAFGHARNGFDRRAE